MKKLILLPLLLMVFLMQSAAQSKFTLTPDGFRDSVNLDQNYIVADFEGMTQKDLYNRAVLYFNTAYFSPKEVMSSVEDQIITIAGAERHRIPFGKKLFGKYVSAFDLKYSFTVRFKDGKIRMDEPSIEMVEYKADKKRILTLNRRNLGLGYEQIVGIFKKNGEINSHASKDALEEFFNGILNGMIVSINNENQSSDW